MNVSTSIQIDIKPSLKILGGETFGLFSAQEFRRLVDDYVPMNTGQLAETDVQLKPWEIEYFAPYVVPVYNGGRGGNARFKTELHGKACKEWDRAAVRDGKDKNLARSMQGWVDKNL